ncbi:MAG: beta-lactamase family protein, partial [Dehalococcoidia bacterium]|nr:beta-lactamase family protein [Dehalococcoidia bacterium]
MQTPTTAPVEPQGPLTVPTSVDLSSDAEEVPQLVEELMRTGVEVAYRENGPLIRYPTILGVVLLGKGDEIAANVARGLADADRRIKMSPTTRFPLGAIADLFAVTAVLQLHEKGQMALDAPIGTIIADFPHGDKVTTHHLISRTSGLPHISDYQLENDDRNRKAADMALDLLAGRELSYEPGTKFNVTGGDSPTPTDFLMVRYVIEKVSGQSYEEYLDEHIFQPAG